MEQIQRYTVKFDNNTLDITGMGINVFPEEGHTILPVEWALVEPFFTLQKNPAQYYPLTKDNQVTGFRRKALFEREIVVNTEGDVVKALRSFENFIADCKIIVSVEDTQIVLTYDPNYFDAITNQENIERLKLANDRLYNIHITRRGDPYALLGSFTTTLNPLLKTSITIPWTGEKDISIYAIAKSCGIYIAQYAKC